MSTVRDFYSGRNGSGLVRHEITSDAREVTVQSTPRLDDRINKSFRILNSRSMGLR